MSKRETSWVSGVLIDGTFYCRAGHGTLREADLAAAVTSRLVVDGRPVVGVFRKHSENAYRFPSHAAFKATFQQSA